MRLGIMIQPKKAPMIAPRVVAQKENERYFRIMAALEKPKDFRVPISSLSSSTIRFMEIRLTSTATRKNTRGNILDRLSILPASSIYSV